MSPQVDAPMLFHMTYRLVKPFMSAETKAKVHFVKRAGRYGRRGCMDKTFARFFDDEMLEEEYGGTLTRWAELRRMQTSAPKLGSLMAHVHFDPMKNPHVPQPPTPFRATTTNHTPTT